MPKTKRTLFRGYNKLTATVLRPSRLIVADGCRLFFAVTYGGDTAGRYAEVDQVVFDRLRTPFAQRNIVFGAAAFITMPFNHHLILTAAQHLIVFSQHLFAAFTQTRLIEFEKNLGEPAL